MTRGIASDLLRSESLNQFCGYGFLFEASGELGPAASWLFISLQVYHSASRYQRGKHHPPRPALRVRASSATLRFRFSELPLPNMTSWPPYKRLNFQSRQQIISNLQSQHLCQVHNLFHLHITLSLVNHVPCLQSNCSLKNPV